MYATGPGQARGFNVMSLSNLKLGGSTRFWCVILAAYMLTSTFGFLILREWRAFVSALGPVKVLTRFASSSQLFLFKYMG